MTQVVFRRLILYTSRRISRYVAQHVVWAPKGVQHFYVSSIIRCDTYTPVLRFIKGSEILARIDTAIFKNDLCGCSHGLLAVKTEAAIFTTTPCVKLIVRGERKCVKLARYNIFNVHPVKIGDFGWLLELLVASAMAALEVALVAPRVELGSTGTPRWLDLYCNCERVILTT